MSSGSWQAWFSAGGGCKGGHFACFAEIFGNFSPPRASPWTVTMQAGWRRGEMVLAGLLGRPCAKAYWLSPGLPADWLEDPAEPVSSPRIATPSCIAGGGAAAPAESYVSRAAHPIQLECVPQSRRLRTGSMLQAPPTAATAATATPAPPQLRLSST